MRVARTDVATADRARPGRWLVLFHQLPPRPHYLRVKVGRQLRRLGAVALKNAVYVLPATSAYREGLARITGEIRERGGEAVACEARFVTGLDDETVEDRFREARDREFAAVAAAAHRLAATLRGAGPSRESTRRRLARDLERLKLRFAEVAARDPFGAGQKEIAAGALSLVEDLLEGVADPARTATLPAEPPSGARWVTRSGVMVDRIASAWLIRRFIDPRARFRFVSPRAPRPAKGELRFDMAGGDFTHQAGACTFEVLMQRFRLRDSALQRIGEIVHDLDLGDQRYRREETSGVGRTLVGMALGTPDDTQRLEQGATILDGLYQSFRKARR